MAGVRELGYIGIEASDIDAWEAYGAGLLGLQLAERSAERLVFRMDGKAHRITVEQGPADDLVHQGYDCGTEADLDAITATLVAAGHAVEDGGADLAARRQVRTVRVTQDPMGNRVELYLDLADAATPFESAVTRSGFQTAAGGAGHAVLMCQNRDAAQAFYELIGFKVSDYIVQEIAPGLVLDAVFMHCNGRHHTLAFAAMPFPKRMQHFMVEVNDRADVGAAWDRTLDSGTPVALTLGQHPNDGMYSFYTVTPSGFEWEYGADGLLVDDSDWEVVTYSRMSSWGHRPARLVSEALAAAAPGR